MKTFFYWNRIAGKTQPVVHQQTEKACVDLLRGADRALSVCMTTGRVVVLKDRWDVTGEIWAPIPTDED